MAATAQSHPHWIQALRFIVFCGVVVLLSAIVTYDHAAPDQVTFFERFQQRHVRSNWNLQLVSISRWLLYGNLALCCLGLLVDAQLRRSKSQQLVRTILFLLGLTLFGLWVHWRRFGGL